MFAWDKETRSFQITPGPGEIEVHEFDYKVENLLVYESKGIEVRSIPAIHTGDGPVSYIVTYEGMKVIVGGDTAPNRWFIEYGKDADLVIHESFMVPNDFVVWYNQPPQLAWACLLCLPHLGPGLWQDHEHDRAGPRRGLSLPQ